MKQILFLLVSALCAASFGANTWFVDDDWYGRSGDGSSDAPFGTIQEAVDAKDTQPGDTILVRPGTYDQGSTNVEKVTFPVRLYVHKSVTIRATAGRAATHLVGASGIGGVVVADGLSVILDGFTIRGCKVSGVRGVAFQRLGTQEDLVNRHKVHLYACEVTDNSCQDAPVMLATVHRTLFRSNGASYGDSTAIYYSSAENCLIAGSSYTPIWVSTVVNCTIAGNGTGGSRSSDVYNSILSMNGGKDYDVSSTKKAFQYSVSGSAASNAPQAVDCAFEQAATNLFVAPALDDWRILSGSAAVDRADPALLAEKVPLPPGYVYRDYYGVEIPTDAARIHAGASQSVIAPAGGICTFAGDKDVLVDGVEAPANVERFVHAVCWPTQWCVKAKSPETAPLSCVLDSMLDRRRFTGAAGTVWVTPPAAGGRKTLTAETAKVLRYMDPDLGSDAYDGTSPTPGEGGVGPWRTFTNAVAQCKNGKRTIVRCAAGTYAEGVVRASRISIPESTDYRLHFIGAGAADTIVRGAESPEPDSNGLGSGAVRCIVNYGSHYTGFTGFTFTGGRTTSDSTWWDGYAGFCFAPYQVGFVETVVSNNVGCADVLYGPVTFERSLMVDNWSTTGYLAGAADGTTVGLCAIGSVFRDNRVTGEYCCFNGKVRLMNATVVLGSKTGGYIVNGQNQWSYNTIFTDCKNKLYDAHFVGCLIDNSSGRLSKYADNFCVTSTPAFYVDKDALDLRLYRNSPAIGAARCNYDDFAALAGCDYEGVPVCLSGAPTAAGAFTRPVANGVSVVDADGRLLIDGEPAAGGRLVDPGTCVTIAENPASKRPVVGITVNGETNLFTSAGTVTLTYEQVTAAGGLLVEPVLGNEWFANANVDPSAGPVGNDANSGFSAARPKRTLASALASAVSGDTVWAAPGRYDDGKMNVASKVMASRADVAAGVTLRSTDGAAKTFIVGAPATAPDAYGCGTDAVRCVYLGAGARLEGFTLTGGRAQTTAPQADATYAGAAVSAAAADAVVSDCVITDCAAQRYVIFQVVLERCRVLGNTAVESQLVRGGRLDNVLFAENRANGNVMQYVNGMVNVTWHSSNKRLDGSTITADLDYHDGNTPTLPAINCLLFACQLGKAYAATNCVMTNPDVSKRDWDCNWRKITDMSKLRLDADYRPVIEPENALVDAGTNLLVAATDASGAPRVMNGTIDIGAMEADWRPVYSACIGRGVTVTAASPEVTRTAEGRVSLGGGSLTMTWAPGAVTSEISFDVTGDGGLRLDHDGTVTGYAKGDGQAYRFKPADDSVQTFVFEGEAEILGIRREKGLILIFR